VKRALALLAAAAIGLSACDEDATTTTGHPQARPLSELARLAPSAQRNRDQLRARGDAVICQFGEGRRSKLVGLLLRRAERRVERAGCTLRVVRRNGADLLYTGDFRPNRINVAVRTGRVSRVVGAF
jgi:hypothetical protein